MTVYQGARARFYIDGVYVSTASNLNYTIVKEKHVKRPCTTNLKAFLKMSQKKREPSYMNSKAMGLRISTRVDVSVAGWKLMNSNPPEGAMAEYDQALKIHWAAVDANVEEILLAGLSREDHKLAQDAARKKAERIAQSRLKKLRKKTDVA
jgi:hypothetical protein